MQFQLLLKECTIEPLHEMATVCSKNDGYGIVLKVYSRNEHNPPHMHLFDLSGNELGKVILTNKIPQSIDELQFDKDTKNLSSKVKNAIVKWGNAKDDFLDVPNWKIAINQWNIFAKDW